MAHSLINKQLYDAICNFDVSETAQAYYYEIMSTEINKKKEDGSFETVKDQILRVYSMLFCDAIGAEPGMIAGPDEVEATADRLYIGSIGLDPQHWYRMQHHFPVIDEDNYDRFAALVIADLNEGPLRDAVINDGEMLLVGEPDPLRMTREHRQNQILRKVVLDGKGVDL